MCFFIEIIMVMDKIHSQNYGIELGLQLHHNNEKVIVIQIHTVIQSSIRITMRHNVQHKHNILHIMIQLAYTVICKQTRRKI